MAEAAKLRPQEGRVSAAENAVIACIEYNDKKCTQRAGSSDSNDAPLQLHRIQINPPPPPPLSEKLTLIVVVDDDGRRSGSVGSRSPVVKAANHDQGWGRRSGTLSPAQAQERVRMRVGLGVGREDRVATAVHAQRRD